MPRLSCNFLVLFVCAGGAAVVARGAVLSPFERYEGSQAQEAALIKSLAQKFLVLQEYSKYQGKKVRGTHAKGTCVDGELEVHDHIMEHYKVGLFAQPAMYKARVRFANGGSTIEADNVPDVRAVSISLDLGNGLKQDFAMNSAPIFPFASLTDFNFLLDIGAVKTQAYQEALADGANHVEAEKKSERAAYFYLATHPGNLPGFTKTLRLGAKLKQEAPSYRNLKYWSGSAFKYGDQQAAKFILSPCWTGLDQEPDYEDPDFLQNDLKNSVNSEQSPVCFDFQVQLLDAKKMVRGGLIYDEKLEPWQWVEDVTLDWDEAGAVSYTVGRLTLTPYSVYDQEACDDPINAIDVMKHSLPEHRGLGRINRARAMAEAASKNNR